MSFTATSFQTNKNLVEREFHVMMSFSGFQPLCCPFTCKFQMLKVDQSRCMEGGWVCATSGRGSLAGINTSNDPHKRFEMQKPFR